MWLHGNGILADANCEGHLVLLLRLFQEGWRHDAWELLHFAPLSLSDSGLQPDASYQIRVNKPWLCGLWPPMKAGMSTDYLRLRL